METIGQRFVASMTADDDLQVQLAAAEHEFVELRDALASADTALEKERHRSRQLEAEVDRLRRLSGQKDTVENVIRELERDEGTTFWAREPHFPTETYYDNLARSIPVLMVGNLKGGVGKTTLAVNLAAHYRSQGERVLLIDLDYQGSASTMVADEDRTGHAGKSVIDLFHGKDFDILPFVGDNRSGVIDCYYPFANVETTLMLRWLAGKSGRDVRYILAEYVQSDAVRSRFDRVVIDTAPRVSTAFVNGFCAATFLVVPTNLDQLSAETVQSFLPLKDDLMPLRVRARSVRRIVGDPARLNYLIVGNRRMYDTGKTGAGEKDAVATIEGAIASDGGSDVNFAAEALIPTKADFTRSAGWGIAYDSSEEVRNIIGRVARQIDLVVRTNAGARQ